MNNKTVTVDVRDDIRSGGEPFSKIMNATAALQAGERLLLIAPFEPVPLFRVLEKQGFVHTGQANASGDWEILFTRETQNPLGAPASLPARSLPPQNAGTDAGAPGVHWPALITSTPAQILDVDARGLEPPQPLVTILESLAALPPGAELRACTDRRPMHLYAQLEERGFNSVTEEQPDGSFFTHIRRR